MEDYPELRFNISSLFENKEDPPSLFENKEDPPSFGACVSLDDLLANIDLSDYDEDDAMIE